MRYRAVVATANEDAFGHTFSGEALDYLAANAISQPVLLMFTQEVGETVKAWRDKDKVSVVFESDKELAGFYCVPSFQGGELACFGLVTAPADSALKCVREIG